MTVTGERVTTAAGGFNPTWQRHVAAYRLCERFLPPGRVADIGCGIGHSYEALAPRETVGVDIDPGCLAGQNRETVVADMRGLPFGARSFTSVLAVQSIEHVPDADAAVAEAARVLEPDGVAVFVTPNRLTFARPDEIIDPYHYVEYDAVQLHQLCASSFDEVEIWGLFGSERYLGLVRAERVKLDRLLSRDPLRVRRALPRRVRQMAYNWLLTRERAEEDPLYADIAPSDFGLRQARLEDALDLIAVCRRPRAASGRAGGDG